MTSSPRASHASVEDDEQTQRLPRFARQLAQALARQHELALDLDDEATRPVPRPGRLPSSTVGAVPYLLTSLDREDDDDDDASVDVIFDDDLARVMHG